MESRFRSQDNEKSSINEKLDRLAATIKKLPKKRAKELKSLLKKESFSLKEVATMTGMHYYTIQRAVAKGKIKSFKIGPKIIRIPRSELEKYIRGIMALPVAEVAKILGVTPLTVRRQIKKGKIKGFRFTTKGPWLVDEEEVRRITTVGD